jgi:8-oxo-dGTP diphosphatase
MLRRRAGRYLGGSWDIPGGTVEEGEGAREAAVREALEESGLAVELGEELSQFVNLDTGGRPLCFHTVVFDAWEHGRAGAGRPVVLSEGEHDSYSWLSPDGALTLDLVWHVRATLTRWVPEWRPLS